jgi:hypothetical protein
VNEIVVFEQLNDVKQTLIQPVATPILEDLKTK